jgi:hypothetical protein
MIIPKTCPRCGSEWLPNVRTEGKSFPRPCSSNCGMVLDHFSDSDYELTCRVGQYSISWFPELTSQAALCIVFHCVDDLKLDPIENLGILDYTITEKQLALYEAFE